MPSEPTVRDGALTTPLLLKLLVAGALSFAVVSLLPHTVSAGGDVPPVRMLLETAVIVSVICAAALFWGIRSDLGLPAKVAVYAVLFNTLVIVVKLTLGPHGFYEVNQIRNLESGFEIDDSLAALAFDATSKRADAVGDATMYMSFFWVGLYFLALYHVLWVVYVLVLTSMWPLKVVTPK